MWAYSGRNIFLKTTACAVFLAGLSLASQPAAARDFTAGVVLDEMKPAERYGYLAGIVEGLAYARYRADSKDTAGMACIYGWFYGEEDAPTKIEAAFARFRDLTPGAIVAALLQRRCGP